MTWNSYIAVRWNEHWDESAWETIKSWADVDKAWSTMGEWDCWLSLKNSIATTEDLEKFVLKLRKQPWVSTTHSWWWKEE